MKKILTLIIPVFFSFTALAQNNWNLPDDTSAAEGDYVLATFKGTRVINFHTVEVVGKRTLDFRISHRFGEFSSGSYNLYGIDGPANIRLGLEYSYNGRLMGGIGRSSNEKQYDGFLKFRFLRQTEDNRMPVSLTLFSGIYYTNQKDPNKQSTGFDKYKYLTSRLSYVHQVIVARKINSSFSVQIAPVMVHYNMAESFTDLNDMFLVAGAARYKITKRVALTAEYAYSLKDYSTKDYFNPLGFGFDIETGGHVFQIHVTNSFGIADNQYFPYTSSSWKKEGMRIGFNVSRVFTL